MSFRPLLAEKVHLPTLEYPTYASPKYDGFRCIINGMGEPMSRNMKPVANGYVFSKIKEMNLPKFDGELLTYTNDKVDDFNTIQSKLSTRSGMPDFKYMVFDQYMLSQEPFCDRYGKLETWFKFNGDRHKRLELVPQLLLDNEEALLEYEASCLADGWEGVMVRGINGPYKFGRSTVREGILLKLKRFFDAEAVVVQAHELRHNANEATTNVLGYTERSSHKANMQGMDTLGKFTVRWGEVEFDVGTGFTAAQRDRYWREPDKMVGMTLTFKYQSLGPSGKPRFPVFLGFRHDVA